MGEEQAINAKRRRLTMFGLATVTAVGVVLAGGTPVLAAPAEGVIHGQAKDALPGSYIVQLKSTSFTGQSTAQAKTKVTGSAKALSDRHGGTVTSQYSATIKGFTVRDLTEGQAKRLAGDPSVASVQRDMQVKKSDTQISPTWGLDRIDQRATVLDGAFTTPNAAPDVTVYVIDSGSRKSHLEFGGRNSWGPNFVNRNLRPLTDNNTDWYWFPDNVNSSSDPQVSEDCDGHGTHVAGTVSGSTYGVAKQAKTISVRVLDCYGIGYTSEILAGIEWVTTDAAVNGRKPAVVNMSLGSDEVDAAQDAAVRRSIASGLTYTIAAGNGDADGNPQDACGVSPARVPEALTVAGITQDAGTVDKPISWSNYGSCVDMYAPGYWITSAYIDYDSALRSISGTSMAAPHVAGAAALILQAHPTYTPDQVRQALVQGATNGAVNFAGSPWYVPTYTPNRLLNVRNVEAPKLDGRSVGLSNPRYGSTEVYGRSTDNSLIYAYKTNEWSDWVNLGGPISSDPAVLYNPRFGSTEVYARMADGTLGYRYYNNGWSGWFNLGGNVAGAPAVLYNPKFGTTEVYVRTTDNKLKYRYFSNGWSDWVSLDGDVASDPSLLYNPTYGTTEAYVRTTDNKLKYRVYYQGWSGWIDLGGNLKGNPQVIYNPTYGTTEVYARTAADTLAYVFYYKQWYSWLDLGGQLATDPGLVYNPRYGTTEAFVGKADGSVEYRFYYKQWYGWTPIGGNTAVAPSVVLNQVSKATQVYTRTADKHSNFTQYDARWLSWTDVSA